jgi:hypothetical protein
MYVLLSDEAREVLWWLLQDYTVATAALQPAYY